MVFPGKGFKTIIGILAFLIIALPSAGFCADRGAQKPIKIGVSISFSGPLAREGGLMKQGYDLWMDTVNKAGGIQADKVKRPVELIYYDDKGDAFTSAKLIEKLISDDKADFIFGPYGSGITAAVSAISEKYKKIMVAPMANADEVYTRGFKYLFGLLPPVSRGLGAHIDLMLTLNPKPQTVAIVWPDDLFPAGAAKATQTRATEAGLKVIYASKYPKATKDLTPLLSEIKTKAPDALICAGYFEDSALLVKQAREMKVEVKYLGNVDLPLHKDFPKVLGKNADYIYGASTWWVPGVSWKGPVFKNSAEYEKLFKAKYNNQEPTHFDASAAAAGVILQIAIEKAGSIDVEKVRDVLSKTDTEIFFGKVRYDERGANTAGTGLVIQLQNGKATVVWPKEIRQAEPMYPMPSWDKR